MLARTPKPNRTARIVAGTAAVTTLALAGAAWFNHAAARRAERDYPPAGRLLQVDGVTVHIVDTGAVEGGETIVLLPGNGSLVEDFMCSGLVDALRVRHRLILIDRPGYGHTDRPDDRDWTAEAQAALCVAACAQIGVTRPVVVGHSWGAIAAVAWALDHPDAVLRLVLLSGYYFPTLRVDAAMIGLAETALLRPIFENAIGPMQTRITGPAGLKMVFSPADVPDDFYDTMPIGLMLRPSQIAASARDGAQMPGNVERLAERYGELTVPIAIAWGDGDKLVCPEGQSIRMAEETGATTLCVAGAGHMVHWFAPTAIAGFIETGGK